MSFEQVFGVIAVVISVLNLVGYIGHFTGIKLPISFWKLKPMQERWGKTIGTMLHFFGYVIVPFFFGISLLLGSSS